MSQTSDFKEKSKSSSFLHLWTEEQWNMVHFSDQSKFNLFGSDGKMFSRRKNREHLSPQSVKKTLKIRVGA